MLYAQPNQMAGQLIGGLIQLQRAQCAVQITGRKRMRLPFDLTIPLLQHGQRGLKRTWCLLDGQRAQAEQRRVGRSQQGLEQCQQLGHETLDGRAAIQVAGKGQVAVNQRAVVGDVQCKVEVRALFIERILADLQTR
ncbi:hypothetical protein ALO56_200186 [Pseudomonas viridiflava]|nr:hypothetical protein ALO56_200186 [Pseudomonas viridiflava]